MTYLYMDLRAQIGRFDRPILGTLDRSRIIAFGDIFVRKVDLRIIIESPIAEL